MIFTKCVSQTVLKVLKNSWSNRVSGKIFKHQKWNRKTYIKQRNNCVSLTREAKQTFFGNINTNDVTNNKIFRRTVKPFFADKVETRSKINLIEKMMYKRKKEKVMIKEVILHDYDIFETFDKFFANIVPKLKMIPSENFETTTDYETEVQNAINKNHPSIKMITSYANSNKRFFLPSSAQWNPKTN